MSTSAKTSKSVDELMKDAEALRNRSRATTSTKEEVKADPAAEKFASIKENTFYKIIFDPNLDADEKQKAIAEARVYNKEQTKQENKARMEEYATFKEYVHFERKRMAQEIISLTDTDTFGELKQVFEDMNMALMNFENEISPLMEILDAVYEINKQGGDAVYDVFKQIEADRQKEKELAEQQAQQEAELKRQEEIIRETRLRNMQLAEEKTLFFFGPSKATKEEIARNELEIERKNQELADLSGKIQQTIAAKSEVSGGGEYAEQKEKIRKLLDISTPEHKERSERLVQMAQTYIDTTYTRTTSVLEGLRDLSTQIDRLGTANGGMHEVFAILSDAGKNAEVTNEELRAQLQNPVEGETNVARMKREQALREVEEYIGLGMQQSADDVQAIQSLTNESLQIKSLRDTNSQQIISTQTLSSSGVSGIASQLATVLQGVSAASLDQSRETSQLNIDKMNRMNEAYLKKGVMQSAMGIYKQNDELVKTIDRLRETGEFIRNVNEAVGTGVRDMRKNLNEMEAVAKSMKKDVDDSVAISADTIKEDMSGVDTSKDPANDTKKDKKAPAASPFGFGGPK